MIFLTSSESELSMTCDDPNEELSSGTFLGLSELNSSVSREDSESFTRAYLDYLPVLLNREPIFLSPFKRYFFVFEPLPDSEDPSISCSYIGSNLRFYEYSDKTFIVVLSC